MENKKSIVEFNELEFRLENVLDKDSKLYHKDKLFTGIAWELGDNNIKLEAAYKDGIQNGEANTYSNEKRIKCSIIVNGKYNGLQKEWYEDGQLKSERLMKDGEIVGKQISYYENGKIKTIVVDGVPIH